MNQAASRWVRPAMIVVAILVLLLALIVVLPLFLRTPQIVRATPVVNATLVNPLAPLTFEFDQRMNTESVAAALHVDPPTKFTVEWQDKLAVVRMDGGLRYGAAYSVTLDTTARNTFGRTIETTFKLAFQTAPYAVVRAVLPADSTQGVDLLAPLTVIFSAPVFTQAQVAAMIDDPRIAGTLPQPLAFTPPATGTGLWVAPDRYIFSPAAGWLPGQTYRVTLNSDLSGDGAARLATAFDWGFSTRTALLAGTRPFDGATEVSADTAVEVRLAPGVDPASAGANFTLTQAGGATVAGQVAPGTNAFFFRPTVPLVRGATYEARLAPGIQSVTGAPLNTEPLAWGFRVMSELAVDQVAPAPDTTEVPTTTRQITVRFNHPVVPLVGVAGQANLPTALTITPPLNAEGRWIDTSTFALSTTAPLAPATRYEVEVLAGLRDQTGSALQAPFRWSFSTIMPQVIETTPWSGYEYTPPSQPITVTFNQPMNPASLQTAVQVVAAAGQAVPGTVAVNGHVATFTPAAPFERGGSYQIVVDASARSAQSGATLPAAYTSAFQVPGLPVLVRSDPANGNPTVEANTSIILEFSAPMDWASVERTLRIEPKPTSVMTSTDVARYYLFTLLEPETDYRITIEPEARDIFGVAIGQATELTFRTAPLPPSYTVVGLGDIGTYNSYVPVRVPVQAINLENLTYALYPIDPTHLVDILREPTDNVAVDENTRIKGETFSVHGDRNREVTYFIEMGALDPGIYLLNVSDGNTNQRQLLAVSPYALTLKRTADQLFVWAVDLATGQPVPDLPLAAQSYSYNTSESQQGDLGATTADGTLQTAYTTDSPYDPLLVLATAQGRFALVDSSWSDGIDSWSFNLSEARDKRTTVGSVFTDRPIYRPGQSVQIKGVIRKDADGRYSLPAADAQVSLVVSDPAGTTLFSSTVALSPFGGFSTSLPIAENAPLGTYSVSAQLDGMHQWESIYGSFNVAAYRKPVFEVTVNPAKTDLFTGDTLSAQISARYFSGGAPTNAPVTWRLLAEPFYFSSENAPGFQFQDLDDAYLFYRWFDSDHTTGLQFVSDGTGKTDAQGNFAVQVPISLGADGKSYRLFLDTDVTDIDGQVISSRAPIALHAGAFYVGIRTDGYMVEAGKAQKVSLITLDPQDQPVANRAVELQLLRREWYSVREQSDNGSFYYTSAYTDTLEQTLAATTDAQGRAEVSITPKQGGSYRILAIAKDDAGHTIRSSAFTWAYGGDVFWGVNDSNRVDLIADRTNYTPGDTAKILVTAPYANMTGLLTIERGEVISHKLFAIQGTTGVIEVPIEPDYAPNVYVSLVLLKPSTSNTEPSELRVGLVNLPVSLAQKQLTISITPDRNEVGPRDQVTYSIKTTDYTGKGVPAEVSLALIDKAVLTLADDPNPSLLKTFYERRPIGVATSQSLVKLVDRISSKLLPGQKGGGGGTDMASMLLRRDFPDTAFWNAFFVTGADGTGSVTVTLPDSLTTWRLIARGVTADTLVGQGTNDVVATRPLLLRPTLPRFLTVGDQVDIQAVIQNNTSNTIAAKVTLDVGGTDSPVTLTDNPEQSVEVAANGQVLVRWRIAARTAGEVTIQMKVEGGGLNDAMVQKLPIQRLTVPETVASAGQVIDSLVETLALPAGATRGEGELVLNPSLAAGIKHGLTVLEAYPYACTEQTVSTFLPNATTLLAYKQAGREDAALKAELERNLATGLQRLYQLQKLDGGWGWWDRGESQPYISTYAVHGLLIAQKAGYAVDQSVLDRGLAYLEAALADSRLEIQGASWKANARAYTLFVLSEAGRADRGRMVALFDQRTPLKLYGRAYLLMALQSVSGEEVRVKALIGELAASAVLRPTEVYWQESSIDYETMSSSARTTALALQALVRADPTNFLIPGAVRFLMGWQDGGTGATFDPHGLTTHDISAGLMALAEYLGRSGELNGDYSYRATVGERVLSEGSVSRDNLDQAIRARFGLDGLANPAQLILQRQAASGQTGAGRLYYALRLRYEQEAAKAEALDRGVGIQRDYIAVNTTTLSPTGELVSQAQVGDLVQVRLTLNVPTLLRYFALEDMLPAGLEPLNASLKTTSVAAAEPNLDGGDNYWWIFERSEIRDNRVALFAEELPSGTYTYTYLARAVIPGSFQTLPATGYQMYAPEVFGRSGGALFTITAK